MTKIISMKKFNDFIKSVDAVKADYTCGLCKEMCVKPVTLSACFHIICLSHFESLNFCPTCKVSLDNCTTYDNEELEKCVESIKQLDNLYKDLKPINTESFQVASTFKANKKLKKVKEEKRKISDTEVNTSPLSRTNNQKVTDIEKKNSKGETTLHVACRLGMFDKIIDLLNKGANTNTKDNAGWTPLHEVVQNGNLKLVKILLQFNTLIDVPGHKNETPLHEAVRHNHIDIALELVKHGADFLAKNSKGETPLEIASEVVANALLKAADDVKQTQTINITYIANIHSQMDFEDIRLYCVSKFHTVASKLKTLTKSHSNLHIETKLSKKVTHLIIDEEGDFCIPSTEILQGIVHCSWILKNQWVVKSTEQNLEPFEDYEVKGIGSNLYNGPQVARYNKYKQLPGLFDGCHFYFHNFVGNYEISKSLVLSKVVLSNLVIDAGGIVLRRVPNPESIPDSEKLVPYHARKGGKLERCSHFIIFKDVYQPMYNMEHIKALPLSWLIECIEKYELCDP